MTDPLGYVDYLHFYQNESVTGTQPTENRLPTGMTTDSGFLEWRNTYYWDRHAAANGGITTNGNGDVIDENWTNPTIYHWFHFCCSINYVSNFLGSVKKPLEHTGNGITIPIKPRTITAVL